MSPSPIPVSRHGFGVKSGNHSKILGNTVKNETAEREGGREARKDERVGGLEGKVSGREGEMREGRESRENEDITGEGDRM